MNGAGERRLIALMTGKIDQLMLLFTQLFKD